MVSVMQHFNMAFFGFAVIVAIVICPVESIPVANYMEQRDREITTDACDRLGGSLVLTEKETVLSRFIVQEKVKVINSSIMDGSTYYPSASLFVSNEQIKNSLIFKIIRKMPKGAALNIYDLALADIDWIVKDLSYRNYAYFCQKLGSWKFRTFSTMPDPNSHACSWSSVTGKRKSVPNKALFDQALKKSLSFISSDPVRTLVNNHQAWNKVAVYAEQLKELVFSELVIKDFFRRGLQNLKDDNILYAEIRCVITGIKDPHGKLIDPEKILLKYKEVADAFKAENPDFFGVKIIQTVPRFTPKLQVLEDLKVAIKLNTKYPDFLIGFDLQADESMFPLASYFDILMYPSSLEPPAALPLFLTVGETNWQGTDDDYHVLDALLLNAERVSSAFSMVKHPRAIKAIENSNLAIEVTPYKDQMMRMVTDLRNHPANILIANNLPIVIGSGYPAMWEAYPLSHDFYAVLMSMTGMRAGLSVLKQLAINSVKYSYLNDTERPRMTQMWEQAWDKFAVDTVSQYGLKNDTLRDIREDNELCSRNQILSEGWMMQSAGCEMTLRFSFWLIICVAVFHAFIS